MSNNQLPEDSYLKNFALMIPTDVVRRDDGKPAICIRHKQEFIAYMKKENKIQELEQMTWAQRDEEYLKWLDTMQVIPATHEKLEDGSILWTHERLIPKQLNQ